MTNQQYMEYALSIAAAAKGRTSPNPMVGAVLVKNNRVVGFGAHLKAGTPHAEVHAVRMAADEAAGSDLYVTLEPCSHYGKTPPCADLVIREGIRKVYVAMQDPNPVVSGNGIQKLRAAGVPVEVGLCEDAARRLNEVFVKNMTTQMPFVTVKAAATLDGKIATVTGDSKWITGEEARTFVHHLRDQYDGIMVGIGTVLHDNPQLTTRLSEGGKNPTRIIVDPQLRVLGSDSQIEKLHILDTTQAPTIFLSTIQKSTGEAAARLQAFGCTVVGVPERIGQPGILDLEFGLRQLYQNLNICSILVEGGATLNWHLLQQFLIDKVYQFIAPKLIGGSSAPSSFGGVGVPLMDAAWLLENVEIKQFGQDICCIGYLTTDLKSK